MPDSTDVQQEITKIDALIASLRETLTGVALEQATLPLQEKRSLLLTQLSGSGAIAQNGSKAVGQQGVMVEGSVGGDVVTGIKAENVFIHKEVDKSLPFPEALSRYLENIIATHQNLQLKGIRTGSQPLSVSLEKVYVSLTALDKQIGEKRNKKLSFEEEFFHGQMGYLTIGMALQRNRRLVIIGDPGCGKTTLISYLGLTYARTLTGTEDLVQERLGLKEASTLPIMLPLRNLGYHLREKHPNPSKDGPSILLDDLREYYAAQQIILPEEFFGTYLDKGEAVLLLDGMDEVADPALRQRVARLIERFASRFEKCRFVVTSREVGYEGASRIGGEFGLAKVREFDSGEVRQFVRDWTRVVETTLAGGESNDIVRMANEQAGRLIQAIESNPRVADLAVNPLLLTVIALVHRYRAQLPERRSELYEEVVEVLLAHWDEAKGLETRTLIANRELDGGDRRSLLEPVAFWMHEGQKREIERDELRSLLVPAFKNMTVNESDARKAVDVFINLINMRSGLLVERGVGVYSFAHLTFQEYLTARALADRKDVLDYTLKRLSDPWWREVFLLVAGYLSTQGKRRVSEFIQAILNADKKTEREPHHHLLLAAECLYDVGPARVEGDLMGLARSQLKQQADAPIIKDDRQSVLTKVLATNALARIESGQVVTRFWKRPYGEPEWITIPAGEFWMGSEKGDDDERPLHKLYLPEFQISRVPITNAQYELFVKDKEWKSPEHWHGGQVPSGLENHPVVHVTWHDALEYCRWLGKKINQLLTLPSEAEWEKAARGDQDQREYPWGEWVDLHCNSSELGWNRTTPVGLFLNGASPYGVLDLSGNVWEWTRSIALLREGKIQNGVQEFNYPYNPNDGREDLMADNNHTRTIRGGAFYFTSGLVRCTFRDVDLPNNKSSSFGFRVIVHSSASL